jgi:hypothetical protein
MFTNIIKKSIPSIIGFLLGIALCTQYLFKDEITKYSNLVGVTEQFKKLSEYTGVLENQYKTQDELQQAAKTLWDKERAKLNDRVKALTQTVFSVKDQSKRSVSNQADLVSTNYQFHEIEFKNKDGEVGPPIGYVLIQNDGRVISKVYNHDIKVDTIITKDEASGRYAIASKAFFVLKSGHLGSRTINKIEGKENWSNKPYPLNIEGGTAIIDPTETFKVSGNSKFHLFNPKPSVGLNTSVSNGKVTTDPMISTNLSTVGPSKDETNWKLINIGFSYDNLEQNIDLSLVPVLYKPAPNFLKNTYIGPGITVDNSGDLKYIFNINIDF